MVITMITSKVFTILYSNDRNKSRVGMHVWYVRFILRKFQPPRTPSLILQIN